MRKTKNYEQIEMLFSKHILYEFIYMIYLYVNIKYYTMAPNHYTDRRWNAEVSLTIFKCFTI